MTPSELVAWMVIIFVTVFGGACFAVGVVGVVMMILDPILGVWQP